MNKFLPRIGIVVSLLGVVLAQADGPATTKEADAESQARAEIARASKLFRLEQSGEAREALDRGLQLLEQIDSPELAGALALKLAGEAVMHGAYEHGASSALQALERYRDAGATKGQIQAWMLLGQAYSLLWDDDRGKVAFQQAAALLDAGDLAEEDDEEGLLRALVEDAVGRRPDGDVEARTRKLLSREDAPEMGRPYISHAMQKLQTVTKRQASDDEVKAAAEALLRDASSRGDKGEEAAASLWLGIVAMKAGQFEVAISYLASSVGYYQGVDDRQALMGLALLSTASVQLGRPEEAIEYGKRSISVVGVPRVDDAGGRVSSRVQRAVQRALCVAHLSVGGLGADSRGFRLCGTGSREITSPAPEQEPGRFPG